MAFGSLHRLQIRWRNIGLVLLILFCWAVGSMPQLMRDLHGVNLYLVSLTGVLCTSATMAGLRYNLVNAAGRISAAWLVAFWAVMLIFYLAIYPISQWHIFGVGSDSEDALRIASTQLMQFHYPYYTHTYLGNPISPLPGAVLLAGPFQAVGRVSLQNVFWLAIFILFCIRLFRHRATVLAFLIVMTFGTLVTLNNFLAGTDYTVNLWYVCAASLLFLKAHVENYSTWKRLAAGVLLGVTLSSRPVYPLILIPLLIAYLSQHKDLRCALLNMSIPLLVAAAITAPFYFYDSVHFSPLRLADKLEFLSPNNARAALVILPMIAISIACSGFFVRLTMARLFLIAGIASSSILLTPGILLVLHTHSQLPDSSMLSYANVSVTLIALWAFCQFESTQGVAPGAERETSISQSAGRLGT
jgi:hypothetical protein